MKHLKLFFALFAMLALGVGNAWAEESVVYTLTPAATGGNGAPHNSYAAGADFICDEITWNITGNSYMVPWRIGGKNLTNVDRTLYSKTVMPHKVTKIEVTHGTASSVTVNSFILIVASDANFSNVISTVDGTFEASSTATLACPNGADWSNAFYKFVYNVTIGSSNKFIQFTEAKFYGEASTTPGEGGGEDPTPDPEEPGTGTSGEVTFVFDTDQGLSELGIAKPNAGAGTNLGNNVYTKAPINMTATDGGTATRVWNSSGATTLRVYKSTGSLTFSSEATINKIVFNTSITATASVGGTLSGTTWTGETKEVKFTFGANATIKTIAVSYVSSGGETPEPEIPAKELTNDLFAWSAATAEATMGASNTFPTLTNTLPVTVTYESSNTDAATIAANGDITLVASGSTTISAKFAGGEVGGTTYAAKTVSYTLTVKPAPLDPIAGGVIDILNQEWTGVSGTTYTDVAEKTAENTGHSNAKYVAQCAGDKSSIQLRSNNSNSGVVSTVSGGVVKRIEVEWNDGTDAERTLQIYGSNTAYTAATDLYGDAKGELLGELNKGNGETTLDFSEWTGDYKYIGFRSKSGAMYLTTITITWLPINSKVTIDGAIQNGSVSVNDATDLNAVAAGTELTLSNTPATNYKLAAYDVYKTGDNTTKVAVTDGKFIMPEFDVTISATFELAKTLTGIKITNAATQTTFWQTETFNHNGLKVTAHFDGADDEDVTDKVTVTGSTATAGAAVEVTVSYNEGATTRTATYNITVKAIPNTKETAYSVADAYNIIDKLTTAEGVFISGIISQVDSYNSTYKSITYWISADGTTTKQLQVYSGKGLESADFSDKTDLSVGDQVIVCGTLKKHSGTYEFDKNNYLASHTPTTKDPAGLAYVTTSYTANVGEAFTTPDLTNPHELVVTYSTSDASKATVDANTGAVTIVAAGVVTITAATTGDATHDAGSASYTITISNPAMAVATLPFTFNSGKADIENTAGMTQNGLGSDYSASTTPNSQLKFDGTGDWVVIRFDSEPEKLSYDIKNNSFSGGTFSVQESADGETYTDVEVHTEITNTQNEEHTLLSTSRYVKFIYTNKVNGNVGLGNIKISKPDNRQETGLAWDPETVTLTVSDAFTPPTLINPHSVLGITYKSSNEDVATVSADGFIALVDDAVGTATITATFADGDPIYKPATATCTITVNEYIETIDGEWQLVTDASKLQAGMEIIIASVEVDGKYYTMSKASENRNNRTAVESTISGEKLNPAVGTSVLTLVDAGNGTFALQAGHGNYLYAASSSANQLKEKNKIDAHGQWTITIADSKATIKAEGSSNRNWMQFNPNNGSPLFSCYASAQKDIALYAKKPAHTRTTSAGRYGTICLPGNIVKCLGATLYEVAGKDDNKVIFDEVLTPEAGMPYIFLAHNAEVLFYCGDQTAATPGDHKSLHGTFTVLRNSELEGMYMVQNNKIVECNPANSGVAENRAYFDGDELEALRSAPAPMPGRRRITMGTESENTATGTEDVVAPAGQTLKLIENGQLIIIRNGEKFNAQGQKL